jgi:iron complex outermembrane receptor protein
LLRYPRHFDPVSSVRGGPCALGNDPQLQWSLRSAYDLGAAHEIDLALRHVAALPDPVVPAYTAVDLHYGWRVRPDLMLSVVGQNLFDPRHAEFGSAPDRNNVARSLLVQLRWTP